MRHLYGDDDAGRMSGFGDFADVHEDADGNLYEWIEGLSAWGEPIGFWQGLSEIPVEPRAPDAPGLGALYQASDGTVYQLHGLGEEEQEPAPDEEAGGEGEAAPEPAPKMGPGKPGEIRVGPDGHRYRWIVGVGAGGKRTGFWRRLKRRPAPRGHAPQARRPAPGAPHRPGARHRAGRSHERKPLLKRLLPIAKVAASLIPIPGAGKLVRGGLTVADKLLTRKKVAGYEGLGALYQAPDGSLYQVQGLEEEELSGFDEDTTFEGAAADEQLTGSDDRNFEGDDGEVHGWADASNPGIEGDQPLEGYVREVPRSDLQAYVPTKPAQTRMFDPTREPPDIWKPIW